MEIENLIESSIESIKKENKLMDKMLSFLEDGNISRFEGYCYYFKTLKEKTDELLTTILDKYKVSDISNHVSRFVKSNEEDIMALLTFTGLLDNIHINSIGEKMDNVRADTFNEEHNKELFSVYLWGINKEKMSKREKEELHDFALVYFSGSQYMRNYFSGYFDFADNISNPDEMYGNVIAFPMAKHSYHSLLNQIVSNSNKLVEFIGSDSSIAVSARRRLFKYQLVAVCRQMEKRELSFSKLDVPISNYSYYLLEEASQSVEEYKEDLKNKPLRKVIYL